MGNVLKFITDNWLLGGPSKGLNKENRRLFISPF